MSSKAELLHGLNQVVDKVENVQATVTAAVEAVDEAIQIAVSAIDGDTGEDAEVVGTLQVLREQLEGCQGHANAALTKAQESISRHS